MAQYVVGLDSSLKRIFVWKTTGDPTTLTNWSAQDTGITVGHQIKSMWTVLNGTDIEIAFTYRGHANFSDQMIVEHVRFDTTTDSWSSSRGAIDVGSIGFPSGADNYISTSIAARTSDLIIGYIEPIAANSYEVHYARGTPGSWTVGIKVDGAPAELNVMGVLVAGASDRVHFFWFDDDNDDVLHRSLSSGNVLDTEATVDAAVGASVLHPIGRGIAYPDNGNTTIKVPYLDADESITSIRIDVSAANPTIATDTAASDNDAEDINSSLVASYAIDGTDTWLLYSGGGASGVDQDIYYDTQADGGSWGTDTEEQDAVTCNRISAGKYTRSATDYIGYLWLDGTTTSYDEIALAAPPAPIPDRLYEVEQHINRSSTY